MHRVLPVGAISLLLAAACASCRNEASDSSKSAPAESQPAKAKPVSDNPMGGCAMCHVDVLDDFAGTKHEAEGVGCTVCHGPSDAHTKDENNEVKPDITFTRKDIDAFCSDCHQCTRPKAAALATRPSAELKVCIDCHGAHQTRAHDPQPSTTPAKGDS
jgi:hypothetical protein